MSNHYCDRCHEFTDGKVKLGPRKILKKGFFENVYDLNVEYSYLEHETYVKAYYYKRNTYCRHCGNYLGEMDYYLAVKYGEVAPRRMITKYYEYCKENGLINEHFFEYHNYPGQPV